MSEASEERVRPAADSPGDVARSAEHGIEPDERKCHDEDGHRRRGQGAVA